MYLATAISKQPQREMPSTRDVGSLVLRAIFAKNGRALGFLLARLDFTEGYSKSETTCGKYHTHILASIENLLLPP